VDSVFIVFEETTVENEYVLLPERVFADIETARQFCAERYKKGDWAYGQVPRHEIEEWKVNK